jgi:hypothetical protein
MATINKRRFWLGVLAGGALWVVFGFLLGEVGTVEAPYVAATATGQFLKGFRHPSFAAVAWSAVLPLFWTIELWVGAILASLVAGWVYKD